MRSPAQAPRWRPRTTSHDYGAHWTGGGLLFTTRHGESVALTEDEVRAVVMAALARNEDEGWRLGEDDK